MNLVYRHCNFGQSELKGRRVRGWINHLALQLLQNVMYY